MSIRNFLLVPLLVSVGVFMYYSSEVISSLRVLVDTVVVTPGLIAVIIVSILLQTIGHIIRAYRMRFLLAPVKPSTTRFQFRALSVGYLFNALLPLRLGELIRTQLIASAERISFSLALVLIIIERAVDAALLSIVGLILVKLNIVTSSALIYVFALLVVSLLVLIVALCLVAEKRSLLVLWHKFTKLFNDDVSLLLRFKSWSVLYGIQRIFSIKRFTQYLLLGLVSWFFYVVSMLIIAQYFLVSPTGKELISQLVAPYYGISIPAGPASLGTFSDIVNTFSFGSGTGAGREAVNLISWAILVLPVSMMGLIFLFAKTKEPLWRKLERRASREGMLDKLSRNEDISLEMKNFLENYFSGDGLSRIVHRLELGSNFRLLRYFKGGSDAITILAHQNDVTIVKKIIPISLKHRLKAQYDWLRKRNRTAGIVRVSGEEEGKDYYAINLEYDDANEMFFDFIHQNSIESSQKVIAKVWECLARGPHKNLSLTKDPAGLETYMDTHIFQCLDMSTKVHEELRLATLPKKITINGKKYDNLFQIMSKITRHKQALKDLYIYNNSGEVHGDVIVDNILVSRLTKKPLIIDPAPDGNIFNGPVFDFGKNMQSFYCGYEFLFRSDEVVSFGDDNSIRFRDTKSVQYNQLCDYVRNELAPKYLTEGEQRAILFHAGALHIRRLKHQVYQNPSNVLAVYAVGVKTLNDFLAQYHER